CHPLPPHLAGQPPLVLKSVQIGNPDFLDDRIEQAASAVVANEKQKQAEEGGLHAAAVAAKTEQIEAAPRRRGGGEDEADRGADVLEPGAARDQAARASARDRAGALGGDQGAPGA